MSPIIKLFSLVFTLSLSINLLSSNIQGLDGAIFVNMSDGRAMLVDDSQVFQRDQGATSVWQNAGTLSIDDKFKVLVLAQNRDDRESRILLWNLWKRNGVLRPSELGDIKNKLITALSKRHYGNVRALFLFYPQLLEIVPAYHVPGLMVWAARENELEILKSLETRLYNKDVEAAFSAAIKARHVDAAKVIVASKKRLLKPSIFNAVISHNLNELFEDLVNSPGADLFKTSILKHAIHAQNLDAFKYFLQHYNMKEVLDALDKYELFFTRLVEVEGKHLRNSAKDRTSLPTELSFRDIIIKAAIRINDTALLSHMLTTPITENYFWLELVFDAVAYQQPDALRLLLDDKRYNEHQDDLLFKCISANNPEAVKIILNKDWENYQLSRNSLTKGATKGLNKIRYLLCLASDKVGLALVFGAYRGHRDVVKLALAHGADPNFMYETYMGFLDIPSETPPLIIAAGAGYTEVVEALLREKRTKKDTVVRALEVAVHYGRTNAVRMLLEDERGDPETCQEQLLVMGISYPELIPLLPKFWLTGEREIKAWEIN